MTDERRVDYRSVAVLIPALDEEASLPGVLRAIPAGVGRIVVVDNGSEDDTASVAEAEGADVVREPERGYGAACLAGIRHLAALEDPPAVIVFLDADHSDDPGKLPSLVAPILTGQADLVLGVRRTDGSVPMHALWGNRLVLGLTRLLFGRSFRDLPPFRAIRSDRLASLDMDDRNWGWTLQMQLRAVRAGLRIEELELPYRKRPLGRSKVSGSALGSLRAGAKMLFTLARESARRSGSRSGPRS